MMKPEDLFHENIDAKIAATFLFSFLGSKTIIQQFINEHCRNFILFQFLHHSKMVITMKTLVFML